MDIPAYGEKNLAKRLAENDKKKSLWSLAESEREREREREREKVLKKFWKSERNKSKLIFLKTWFMSFDWSKISFDRSKQTEAL